MRRPVDTLIASLLRSGAAEKWIVTRLRRSTEAEKLREELEESRPYLGLAREIHDEVQRIAADPATGVELLGEAFDRWPREARLRAAERAFDELPAERRWEILAELFDDAELRAALASERDHQLLDTRRTLVRSALAHAVRERKALDTRDVPADEELTVGLFREVDVRAALAQGSASTACARRLVLRGTGDDGTLRVIEDVFNPARGLFVTADYDERVWSDERLTPHSLIRIGSLDGSTFVPVVYPGGRVDVEAPGTGTPRRGRLHAGYATVGDVPLFMEISTTAGRRRGAGSQERNVVT